MTAKRQETIERLKREFEVCDKHILRVDEALRGLRVDFPITLDVYQSFDSDQIRCIDQFIFRFSKLQDAIGAKIFRFTLEILDEDVTSLPMRDILNRLERFNIIPSADEWIYIRELRNEIAHDYPLYDDEIVAILNELFVKVEVVINIYKRLKAYMPSDGEHVS